MIKPHIEHTQYTIRMTNFQSTTMVHTCMWLHATQSIQILHCPPLGPCISISTFTNCLPSGLLYFKKYLYILMSLRNLSDGIDDEAG